MIYEHFYLIVRLYNTELYIYQLDDNGIALLINPRQKLFTEGLSEKNSFCGGLDQRAITLTKSE